MSKHRPAATFDELDDAEVQIRLDEETYRRLQRAFLDAVDHGHDSLFSFAHGKMRSAAFYVV